MGAINIDPDQFKQISSKEGLDRVIRLLRRSSSYGLAFIALAALVLIRVGLDHWFLGLGSFLIFLPPVIFAAVQEESPHGRLFYFATAQGQEGTTPSGIPISRSPCCGPSATTA
jgi:hypothetical protein